MKSTKRVAVFVAALFVSCAIFAGEGSQFTVIPNDSGLLQYVSMAELSKIIQPIEGVAGRNPTVALVLSGGGGRGLAHIAVIEEVEKLGIPVDMVLGTSMGALIGGMYSAGYSPGDIRRMIEDNNMAQVLISSGQANAPVITGPFERINADMFSVGFGDGNIGSGPSLVGDQGILALLNTALANVAPFESFDDLSIPFRCIATDAVTGDEIVFTGGSLATAIRSSISIPVVFPPYPIGDGRLAVDGGLVNNMPVVLARLLGADIVIACDVNNDQIVPAEQLNSISQVLTQSLSIVTNKNVLPQYPFADVVLTPELGSFSTYDFFSVEAITAAGKVGVEEMMPELQALVDKISLTRPLQFIDPTARGPYYELPESIIIEVVREDVSEGDETPTPMSLKSVRSFLGQKTSTATLQSIATVMSKLKATYRFAAVSFDLRPVGTDEHGNVLVELVVQTRSYPETPGRLYLGAHGPTTFTFGPGRSFGMQFNPSLDIGVIFNNLTNDDFDLSLMASVDQAVTLKVLFDYPFYGAAPTRLNFTTNAGFSAGTLSVVNDIANPGKISSIDFGMSLDAQLTLDFLSAGRFNFGAKLSLAYLGAMQVPSNVTVIPGKEWNGLFLFTPMFEAGVVWSGLPMGSFPMEGLRVDFLGNIGMDRSTLAYSLHASAKQVFEVAYDTDSIWYDVGIGTSRLSPQLSSSYFDFGSWSGMPGYGARSLVRDYLLAGFGWQHVFNANGYPIYLQAVMRIGARDSFNPFGNGVTDTMVPPSYAPFTQLSGFEMGFGLGVGFGTPIGDFIFGFGSTIEGKMALYVELW